VEVQGDRKANAKKGFEVAALTCGTAAAIAAFIPVAGPFISLGLGIASAICGAVPLVL
jgi:hypothetical protein